MLFEKLVTEEWKRIKQMVDEAATKERLGRPPFFEATMSFARRPLITSRFILLLTLLDDISPEEAKKALGLGNDGPPYRHNPPEVIRRKVQGAVVLDPFAGGGSIPIEAARLGAKAIAVEYSPVQWAVLKVIETAQTHPQLINVEKWEQLKKKYRRGFQADMKKLCSDPTHKEAGPLVTEGCRIVKELEAELNRFYPPHNGKEVTHYIWTKQVRCPKCGAWVPLAYQFDLGKGRYWYVRYDGGDYEPYVAKGEAPPGTISEGEARCPRCKVSIPNEYIRKNVKGNDRLVLIRTADGEFHQADKTQVETYNLMPEPERLQELITPNDPHTTPPLYGYTTFGDLFNKRQHTVLNHLVNKLKSLDPALRTVLAWLTVKHADRNSILTSWDKTRQNIKNSLAFKVLTMSWDYVEANPFALGSGSLYGALHDVVDGFAFLVEALRGTEPIEVRLGSALSLPFEDRSIKYVVTDPPYYDNIPYPEVYDFAYVWLKRVLGDVYPDVFSFWALWRDRSAEDISVGGVRTKEHFEALFEGALREVRRVLRDDGVLVMYFAHSRREAWVSIMRILHGVGFSVVNTIPIKSESSVDVQARGKVSPVSSVALVARPRAGGEVAYVERLKPRLREEVARAVLEAHRGGVRGVDLLMVAYSAALKVATQYGELKSLRGDPIEDVISFADEVAVATVVEELFGASADKLTEFYVYAVNEHDGVLDSDTFLLLSKLTASGEELRRSGLIREAKRGSRKVVEVVDFVDRCDKAGKGRSAIDVLHRLLCAFAQRGKSGVENLLSQGGFPHSLDEICKLAEVVYGGGWGAKPEVVKGFMSMFCGRIVKSHSLLDYA